MNAIDWTQPLQVRIGSKWYDVISYLKDYNVLYALAEYPMRENTVDSAPRVRVRKYDLADHRLYRNKPEDRVDATSTGLKEYMEFMYDGVPQRFSKLTPTGIQFEHGPVTFHKMAQNDGWQYRIVVPWRRCLAISQVITAMTYRNNVNVDATEFYVGGKNAMFTITGPEGEPEFQTVNYAYLGSAHAWWDSIAPAKDVCEYYAQGNDGSMFWWNGKTLYFKPAEEAAYVKSGYKTVSHMFACADKEGWKGMLRRVNKDGTPHVDESLQSPESRVRTFMDNTGFKWTLEQGVVYYQSPDDCKMVSRYKRLEDLIVAVHNNPKTFPGFRETTNDPKVTSADIGTAASPRVADDIPPEETGEQEPTHPGGVGLSRSVYTLPSIIFAPDNPVAFERPTFEAVFVNESNERCQGLIVNTTPVAVKKPSEPASESTGTPVKFVNEYYALGNEGKMFWWNGKTLYFKTAAGAPYEETEHPSVSRLKACAAHYNCTEILRRVNADGTTFVEENAKSVTPTVRTFQDDTGFKWRWDGTCLFVTRPGRPDEEDSSIPSVYRLLDLARHNPRGYPFFRETTNEVPSPKKAEEPAANSKVRTFKDNTGCVWTWDGTTMYIDRPGNDREVCYCGTPDRLIDIATNRAAPGFPGFRETTNDNASTTARTWSSDSGFRWLWNNGVMTTFAPYYHSPVKGTMTPDQLIRRASEAMCIYKGFKETTLKPEDKKSQE